MNIFVGNLSSHTTEQELEHLFVAYGEVRSVDIIMDGRTGNSRGFGFVEMQDKEDGEHAIKGLNATPLNHHALAIHEAIPRTTGNERFNSRTF
jgi:RNA recognition motif-containing protein